MGHSPPNWICTTFDDGDSHVMLILKFVCKLRQPATFNQLELQTPDLRQGNEQLANQLRLDSSALSTKTLGFLVVQLFQWSYMQRIFLITLQISFRLCDRCTGVIRHKIRRPNQERALSSAMTNKVRSLTAKNYFAFDTC